MLYSQLYTRLDSNRGKPKPKEETEMNHPLKPSKTKDQYPLAPRWDREYQQYHQRHQPNVLTLDPHTALAKMLDQYQDEPEQLAPLLELFIKQANDRLERINLERDHHILAVARATEQLRKLLGPALLTCFYCGATEGGTHDENCLVMQHEKEG